MNIFVPKKWNKSKTSFPKVKRQHKRCSTHIFCTTAHNSFISVYYYTICTCSVFPYCWIWCAKFFFLTLSLILFSFTFFSLYRTKFYGSAVHTIGNEVEVKLSSIYLSLFCVCLCFWSCRGVSLAEKEMSEWRMGRDWQADWEMFFSSPFCLFLFQPVSHAVSLKTSRSGRLASAT